MSFHLSCEDLKISQEHGSTYLMGKIRNMQGHMRPTKIRLDDHIGNTDGWFIWGGSDFTKSASDVRLEHTHDGPKLTADLKTREGGSKGRQGISLADKIVNSDGHLRFLGA